MPDTQKFWWDTLLDYPMPAARNEQEYQKELDDYYSGIEKQEGIDERPDDWAVRGSKRGSLDRMGRDIPPYYPVPGDVLKDKNPGVLEDRPWMKPGPSMSNIATEFWDQPLLKMLPKEYEVGTESNTRAFWEDYLLHGPMPVDQSGPIPDYNYGPPQIAPGTQDRSSKRQVPGTFDAPAHESHQYRHYKQHPSTDYTDLTWDHFPLV